MMRRFIAPRSGSATSSGQSTNRAIPSHIRALAGAICCCALLAPVGHTFAKEELRELGRYWFLWDGRFSGHFDTAEAVIEARNANQEEIFAACSNNPCATCQKWIHDPPTIPGGPVVNGEPTGMATQSGNHTLYYPACPSAGRDPIGPT